MDERTFHEVKPEDMERIACGKCGAARAVYCEKRRAREAGDAEGRLR